jgi:hypothetical protein
MLGYGKVIGGQFMNATVTTNRKGELALQPVGVAAFKRRPTLTADTVASWEEILDGVRGGAMGAVNKVGQAAARAALPGRAGKAASAAVGSAVDSVSGSSHTVRVDWVDGAQSLIQLPDKLFQHLSLLLKDRRLQTATSPSVATTGSASSGVVGQLTALAGSVRAPQPDAAEQIAKLAALRDQGAITDEEFAAKKTELLGRI